MADSDIVMKNLTKGRLRRMLNMLCIHVKEYHAGHFVCHWQRCNACLLCEIPWTDKNAKHYLNKQKDLCYAIWHEDILNA